MRELAELRKGASTGGGALEMVCSKCTRHAFFGGNNAFEAAKKAKAKGWVMKDGKTIGPCCVPRPTYTPTPAA